MRRLYALLAGLILLSLLLYGVNAFWTLIGLLFETGEADLISRAELDALLLHKPASAGSGGSGGGDGDGDGSSGESPGPAQYLIPSIIHQTYKNESVPQRWQEPWAQCQALNKDYVYYLWTDATARAFISTHYPSFLATYDAYPYPIQRADAIRYFVLAHYGGTYIDLDLGCALPLEPLRTFPLWLHRTQPTGISNDAMGSAPNHPFWTELVLPSLAAHAVHLPLPYATVMASTGPLFLSQMWKQWMGMKEQQQQQQQQQGTRKLKNVGSGRVRVLREADFDAARGGWFNSFGGSSWHGEDVRAVKWVGAHWLALCGVGAGIGVGIGLLVFVIFRGGISGGGWWKGGGGWWWWRWRGRGRGMEKSRTSARARSRRRMRMRMRGVRSKRWLWGNGGGDAGLLEQQEEEEDGDPGEDSDEGGGS